MGVNIITPLATEAALPGKRPDHRIRILNVIQRIGGTLDPDAFYTVSSLMNNPVDRVARKAAEVILAARHPAAGLNSEN